jgi:hypothetical protein
LCKPCPDQFALKSVINMCSLFLTFLIKSNASLLIVFPSIVKVFPFSASIENWIISKFILKRKSINFTSSFASINSSNLKVKKPCVE